MLVRTLRSLDPPIILLSLLLTLYGTLLIFSGSLSRFDSVGEVVRGPIARQIAFLAVGIALMLVTARIDYRLWGGFAPLLYVLALGTLVFVLFFGAAEYGSRRWVVIAGTPMQPSEPAKLVTIVLLARLLSANSGGKLSARTFLLTLLLAAIPALLVFRQPDLGTAIVFGVCWLAMVYLAGARLRHIGLLLSAALVALPFIMLVMLHGYQKERLSIFFNPDRDPLGSGFNINQAAISIGSGGWFGKGLTDGTQTQLDFLRTQTTDYIFSVLGEELGFVGAMVLFALFILLLLRGLRIAALAPDDTGRLIATGIVVMIMTQVFINIGVNIRLFPVTGIPLPFISQGGSSLMTMFVAMGLLQSILSRRRPPGMTRTPERLGWTS